MSIRLKKALFVVQTLGHFELPKTMAKLNQLGLLFETNLEFRNQLYSFMLTLPDLKSYLGMTCLRELKLPTGGAGGFVDPWYTPATGSIESQQRVYSWRYTGKQAHFCCPQMQGKNDRF